MSPKETVAPYNKGGRLSMPGILQGKDRIITVEGLSSENGVVISRGRSLPIDVGANKQDVTIFIARVGRFSDSPGNGLPHKILGHTAVADPSGMVVIAGGASKGEMLSPSSFVKKPLIVNPMDMSVQTFSCDNCRLAKRAFGVTALATSGFWLIGGEGDDGELTPTVDFVDLSNQTVTASDLNLVSRTWMSAIPFATKTIIAGGLNRHDEALRDVEIVMTTGDVLTDQLPEARYGMAAGRVGNQGVFFGGFSEDGEVTNDAFIIDADTLTISRLENDLPPRAFASAVSLSDGRLLFIGGQDGSGSASGSIDLFDPAVGALCSVGNLAFKRWFSSTTLLPDGRVLVVGGLTGNYPGQPTREAQVIDPTLTRVTSECAELDTPISVVGMEQATIPRYLATATLTQNGNVILIGGFGGNHEPLQSIEVYVPQE